MVQLWVNLPAKDKMSPPGYQGIVAADIPVVDLPNGGGTARVIAGEFHGHHGPARTFTPINVWDMKLEPNAELVLPLPEGHTAMLVGLSGSVTVGDNHVLSEAQMLLLGRPGDSVSLHADSHAAVLVLTGEPIDEPIVGHGPFVMNSEAEIHQAISDLNSGRFLP